MIDGKNVFDQLVKNDFRTYDNIQKIAIGQVDDYATGCLLDYPWLKKDYELIAIDLSKQQKLDDNPKPVQQINLLEIQTEMVMHICFSLLKKRKKQF